MHLLSSSRLRLIVYGCIAPWAVPPKLVGVKSSVQFPVRFGVAALWGGAEVEGVGDGLGLWAGGVARTFGVLEAVAGGLGDGGVVGAEEAVGTAGGVVCGRVDGVGVGGAMFRAGWAR